jgi:hypothetical protein
MPNNRDAGFAPMNQGRTPPQTPGEVHNVDGVVSPLCLIPLVANRHVADIEAVVDGLATTLARLGRRVLVVDAADSAPLAPELARLGVDWQAGVERLGRGVDYFPARGLPKAFLDHHGSAARFIGTAQAAAPQADTLLLHAEPAEMAQLLLGALKLGFATRPVLLGTDDGHSLQTLYSACKLLNQETGLAQFDVVWAGALSAARAAHMANALVRCAQTYLGATVLQWATAKEGAELTNLLMTHLEMPALAPERPFSSAPERPFSLAAALPQAQPAFGTPAFAYRT